MSTKETYVEDLDIVDRIGFSPLHVAADRGQPAASSLLLAHSSDVDEQTPKTRMTAFHHAAMIGSEETVRTLISYGAALDALDRFKNTALNFVKRVTCLVFSP